MKSKNNHLVLKSIIKTNSKQFHKEYYEQSPRIQDLYDYSIHYTDSTGLKKVKPVIGERTKNYQHVLRREGIPIYEVSHIYQTVVKSWGNNTSIVYKEPKYKSFKYHYKQPDRVDLPKLVCLKDNVTGNVLKLRKGTFNEDLYTYISKQEYKVNLPRKPLESRVKVIKIDLLKTAELTPTEKFRMRKQPKYVTINGKKVLNHKRMLKIEEDLSIEYNYDRFRDPEYKSYKCPPIKNKGREAYKQSVLQVIAERKRIQNILKEQLRGKKHSISRKSKHIKSNIGPEGILKREERHKLKLQKRNGNKSSEL